MALSDAVKGAVDAAFAAADDAVKEIVYNRKTVNANYDPSTGQVAESEKHIDMVCIFSGYSAHETNNSAIQATDVKALIPGKYFSFEPKTGSDTITNAFGATFDIIDAKPDVLGSTYTLQLRRIS